MKTLLIGSLILLGTLGNVRAEGELWTEDDTHTVTEFRVEESSLNAIEHLIDDTEIVDLAIDSALDFDDLYGDTIAEGEFTTIEPFKAFSVEYVNTKKEFKETVTLVNDYRAHGENSTMIGVSTAINNKVTLKWINTKTMREF